MFLLLSCLFRLSCISCLSCLDCLSCFSFLSCLSLSRSSRLPCLYWPSCPGLLPFPSSLLTTSPFFPHLLPKLCYL
jgi:hypothetical protein